MHFNSNNVYACVNDTPHLLVITTLHLWYEQLHCILYRFCLPGPGDVQYFALAPPAYLERLRTGFRARTLETLRKTSLLVKQCPKLIPIGGVIEMLLHLGISNHLAFESSIGVENKEELRQHFADAVAFIRRNECYACSSIQMASPILCFANDRSRIFWVH